MKKNVIKRIVSLTLVALLILTLFAGCKAEPVKTTVEKEVLSSAKQEKVFGKILLSVNPEIEIEYDEDGIVVELEGVNDEGREIVKKYSDFVGKDSETVVKELVQEIYDSGYFSDTIDGNSRNIIVKLEDGSSYPDNGFLERVANGVRDAVNVNQITSQPVVVDKTDVSGSGIIGLEKAKESALTQAGVKSAIFSESEYDREDGVYEFEFVSNGIEYDYEVDALSGKVVKAESEIADGDDDRDSRYYDRLDNRDDYDDDDDHDNYFDKYDRDDD